LEAHALGKRLFAAVGEHLQAQGLKISTGTLNDATIINAPASIKNKDKQRDPEMHSTRKGNQWYFGMKAHIGRLQDQAHACGGGHRRQRTRFSGAR
jgi:transposase, IS5 family